MKIGVNEMAAMNTAVDTGPNHHMKVPGIAKAAGNTIEMAIDGSLENGGMIIAGGMTGMKIDMITDDTKDIMKGIKKMESR